MTNDRKSWYGSRARLVESVMADAQTDDPIRATSFADRLESLHPSLHAAVLLFLQTGQVDPSVSILGYDLARIQREKQVGVLGAFTYIDGLITKPEETLELLRCFPHDSIVYLDDEPKSKKVTQ